MAASEQQAGTTIMVVDDSNTIRRSAEIFLGQAGHEVVLAEDGFEALALLSQTRPALIFCDILMPRLDGYQFCLLVRQSRQFAATPIVMLTSRDGLFDRARGRLAGCNAYLTKPFAKDSLLQAVREHAQVACAE